MLKTYRKKIDGFSLIELLVAMLVGIIIISGAFSLHTTTRKTQRVSEAQMDMVADARFAIEMIAYDLRHAGMWGVTNKAGAIECQSDLIVGNCVQSLNNETLPSDITVSGDCALGATAWAYDLDIAVFASEVNLYNGSCIPATEGYVADTDVLEVKYTDSNTGGNVLINDQMYVRSNFDNGRLFVGAVPPILNRGNNIAITDNFVLHANAYYISDHTDEDGDGIPSLRRASLINGPAVQNQMVISGVVDFQVQFGVNTNNDRDADGNVTINAYLDPTSISDVPGITPNWSEVYSAKIWLLLRSDKAQNVSKATSFTMGNKTFTNDGSDGYRYFMISSVVNLLNTNQ